MTDVREVIDDMLKIEDDKMRAIEMESKCKELINNTTIDNVLYFCNFMPTSFEKAHVILLILNHVIKSVTQEKRKDYFYKMLLMADEVNTKYPESKILLILAKTIVDSIS